MGPRELAENRGAVVEHIHRLRGPRLAIEDDERAWSFEQLFDEATRCASALCAGTASLDSARVVLLASPGARWVAAFFGVLLAGGIVVPLSPLYPQSELAWFARDSGATIAIVSDDLRERAGAFEGLRVLSGEELARGAGTRTGTGTGTGAVILYTSGTTGKPKGAVLTHENVATLVALLGEAWKCTPEDRLLHALPLHHLHGLGIALLTTLLAGGSVRMLPRFDARRVWDELAHATVWMAVPTMYQKLVEAFDLGSAAERERWTAAARRLRLATSGSAALPVTLAERWRAIAGTIPLERFGMTEIGVGMTNPLEPGGRRPGWVGRPLPTVETRIVADQREVSEGSGELWIRGPSVFKTYWNRPDETALAFTDGWFRTGDVAERSPDGMIRLLGRTSVDILKSGGYKISALEIEEALREHAAVREVAVVGLPDKTWGERIVAAIVAVPERRDECDEDALRAWAKERLAAYKVPRQIVVVEALPRNPLGKVVKPELVAELMRRLRA